MSETGHNTQVYLNHGGATLTVGPTGLLEILGAVTGSAPGNVFYVDSVAGSNSNTGLSWAAAVATIQYARSLCTASNGDIILVSPYHVETVTGAAGLALSVAGVRVVGLGRGRQKPLINFTTAAAASVDISAAGVSVENVVFKCTIDAQTAMVNVTAADVSIVNCEFQTADGTYQATLGILTTASADRLRIEQCHFHGTVDAGTESQVKIVGCDSVVIKDNIFVGACATTGNIQQLTTAGTNHVIQGNTFLNQTADGNNKAIVYKSDTTVAIIGNRGSIIDSSGPAPVTAAAGFVAQNYWSSAAGVTASVLM